MPLKKPRSKSRSPAVTASAVISPSTPRGFLPPSHYAAAAGISYDPHSDYSQKKYGPPENSNDTRHRGRDGGHGPVASSSHMPVSSSASSSEHANASRMAMLTRRLSRSGTNPPESPAPRHTRLGDLPLVEAHLVPSLRDTIDRMTHPGQSPPAESPVSLSASTRTNPGRSGKPTASDPQSTTSASTASRLKRPTLHVMTTPPVLPSTPRPSPAPKTTETSRIPTTPSKGKSKSTLKSVLKSSSSSASTTKQAPTHDSQSKGSPSKSLRSVRNMMSRKASQAPIATESVTPELSPSKFPRDYRAHERSRTDPGHVSTRSAFVPMPATPQPHASGSGIPKPSKYGARSRSISRAGNISEDSMPEFELLSEPRRALVVTNADIVPSSSSSSASSSVDGRRGPIPKSPSWSSRVPVNHEHENEHPRPPLPPLPERRIGLGINLLNDRTGGLTQDRVPQSEESLADRGSQDDEESAYDDDDIDAEGLTDGPSTESIARLHSLLRSRSRQTVRFEEDERRAGSSSTLPNPWEYADADEDRTTQHGDAVYDDDDRDDSDARDEDEDEDARYGERHNHRDDSDNGEDRRRREALIGIVHELENRAPAADHGYASEGDMSDGEYTGLAISPSTEVGQQGSARILGVLDDRQPGQQGPRGYGGRGSSLHFSPRARAAPSASPFRPQRSPLGSARGRESARPLSNPVVTDPGVDEQSGSEYPSDDDMDRGGGQADQTPRPTYAARNMSEDYHYARQTSRGHLIRSPPEDPVPNNRRHDVLGPRNAAQGRHPREAPTPRQSNAAGSLADRSRDQTSGRPPVLPLQPRKRRSHHDVGASSLMQGPPDDRGQKGVTSAPKSMDATYSLHDLHEHLGHAEAREREAFGLPPSSPEPNARLPHVDSSSTIGSDRWQDDGDELSLSAEAIFEKLSGQKHVSVLRNSWMHRTTSEPRPQANDMPHAPYGATSTTGVSPRPQNGLLESASTHSIYRDDIPSRPWQQRERDQRVLDSHPDGRTWRSTLPISAYQSLLERYGDTELRRQEVIWELCEAEQLFVKRLRTAVYLFIRPLRMKDSVSWLEGVPTEVARLFDWLEDILNLHLQISSALRTAIAEQYPVVNRFAEVMRRFVPRLEVHQPYLVRVEHVALVIQRMSNERGNDFGEFIMLQQEQPECRGWSLESFLVEPVNRLVDYPTYFRRLWDATPSHHADHLATFSLLHSTEAMIRIMREVKLQEEEYDLVKDRLSRIQGLPPSIQLARRERRLLARGRLVREFIVEQRPPVVGHPSRSEQYLRPPTALTSDRSKPKQSRLISALTSRNAESSGRSNSTKSTTSSQFSFESDLSASSTTPPLTPVSPFSFGLPLAGPQRGAKNEYNVPQSTLLNMRRSESFKQSLVHTLVFTDLIILASPLSYTSSHRANLDGGVESWRLLDDVGISRILGVRGDMDKIVLDLLPLDTVDLESGVVPDSTPVTSLTVTIPNLSSSGETLKDAALADIRSKWMSAFRQCSQHTLRVLSFPSLSGKHHVRGPNVDWEEDSRQSVMSILASGLPLPKSPSVQIDEVVQGHAGDERQQEREERGWWSLRFQQVLREMLRNDAHSQISLGLGGATREAPRKRPTSSRPRPLKLSSLSSAESLNQISSHPRN
ncbi:hypothetical protein FA95DRAFT_309035 [Auriscalpium vulgare]|uniref:Uncharacterized protein n=1 Tax=Auriscalpium vulgare TaxID=40419 RepID=A0ACB8S498_9AGAM|nr:hypothetical protein FA95DRAFT_309035 [Auriscalpium vulgare]